MTLNPIMLFIFTKNDVWFKHMVLGDIVVTAPSTPINETLKDIIDTTAFNAETLLDLQPQKPREIAHSVGEQISIVCDVPHDAGDLLRLSWARVDGRPMPRGYRIDGSSLVLPRLRHNYAGNYKCVLEDVAGREFSSFVQLKITDYFPQFNGQTIINLSPISREIWNQLDLNIAILPETTDAIIFHVTKSSESFSIQDDGVGGPFFQTLSLENGHVRYSYNVGGGQKVLETPYRIDVGKWAQIYVKNSPTNAQLRVNAHAPIVARNDVFLSASDGAKKLSTNSSRTSEEEELNDEEDENFVYKAHLGGAESEAWRIAHAVDSSAINNFRGVAGRLVVLNRSVDLGALTLHGDDHQVSLTLSSNADCDEEVSCRLSSSSFSPIPTTTQITWPLQELRGLPPGVIILPEILPNSPISSTNDDLYQLLPTASQSSSAIRTLPHTDSFITTTTLLNDLSGEILNTPPPFLRASTIVVPTPKSQPTTTITTTQPTIVRTTEPQLHKYIVGPDSDLIDDIDNVNDDLMVELDPNLEPMLTDTNSTKMPTFKPIYEMMESEERETKAESLPSIDGLPLTDTLTLETSRERDVVFDEQFEHFEAFVGLCDAKTCGNHGDCESVNVTHVQCACRDYFVGRTCEDFRPIEYAVNFDGTAFAVFSGDDFPHLTSERDESIELRLKTRSRDGVLFWQGQHPESSLYGEDYVSIGLEDGYLVFSYELGGGAARLWSRRRLNDGREHIVRAIRKGRNGTLLVDTHPPIRGKSSGILAMLNVESNIYVGGVPNHARMTAGLYTRNFVGCVAEIILNGLKMDVMTSAIDGRNLRPCESWRNRTRLHRSHEKVRVYDNNIIE